MKITINNRMRMDAVRHHQLLQAIDFTVEQFLNGHIIASEVKMIRVDGGVLIDIVEQKND